MKRFLTIAGLILIILVVFVGLVTLKMRSGRPEVLLKKLRYGKGAKDVLKMKLNLARGDTVPLMTEAFKDSNADPAFRADILELLFRKYHRLGDQRILPILREALKSPDLTIRRRAVASFEVYGSEEERLCLLDSVDDPDREIRRRALATLVSGGVDRRSAGRVHDERWSKLSEDQRRILIEKCSRKMHTEEDPELQFLARAIIGREIEFLCNEAYETISTAEFEKGEKLLRQALELDPENNQARIRMVRHYLAAGMKKKALELAEKHGALLRIPLLAEAPNIDGDPTDKAWQEALRYVGKPFYHSTSRWAPKEVEGKSDFYIGHRNGTLYIAVFGYEDDLNKLIVKHKGRDSAVYHDDCVEFFFDPSNNEADVYQFVINPIGALFDQYKRRSTENIMCQWGASVFHDRGYWACEFAVAATNLHNRKITADSVWGINIVRARIGPASEHCAWWPTFGWAHRYHLFPIAIFEGL